MKEIGYRTNFEPEIITQCIVDGIPDDHTNKIISYRARNFSDFTEKD